MEKSARISKQVKGKGCLSTVAARCKQRTVEYIKNEPPAVCFLLSLFLISLTLVCLGLYVSGEKEVMDLDAMKNWNAYIGKLKERDYCFVPASEPHEFNNTYVGCKSNRTRTYGTVNINMTFLVNKEFALGVLPGVIYSSFTGHNVGTRIRDQSSGRRVDNNIHLHIWIAVKNLTECSQDVICEIEGCLIISAPLTSVPIRMPQIHRDFTFEKKILNSSRHPHSCSCEDFSNLNVYTVNISDDCSADSSTILSVSKHSIGHRGYGVIKVLLTPSDQKKASHHTLIASLTILGVGIAITFGIVFTDRIFTKTSKA